MNTRKKRLLWKSTYLFIIILLIAWFISLLQEEMQTEAFDLRTYLAKELFETSICQNAPIIAFMDETKENNFMDASLKQLFPVYFYIEKKKPNQAWKESKLICEEVEDFDKISLQQEQEIIKTNESTQERATEQEKATQIVAIDKHADEKTSNIVLPKEPLNSFTKEQLKDPEFILKNFYTVDTTTNIDRKRLDYDKLMSYDGTLKKTTEHKPQILIYHTHSQEAFVDSVPGDANTSIVGVGERLTQILQDEYGFSVLHHTGEYDKESRDYAYSYAAKGLEQVLQENPSIEVIIDLHRDAVKEDTRLVTQLGDQEVAKFMFFNGMSYTNALGSLESLPNPYIQENISFAFQLKLLADEYYPGLTRKTYLKGYRYNMQYRPKSLLIEVGAQNNTFEEAYGACEPLAHLLAMVLTGRNRQ